MHNEKKEGYIPELPGTAPAVIPFTTMVASTSIIEFYIAHRIFGRGQKRRMKWYICLTRKKLAKKTHERQKDDCFCGNNNLAGCGDVDPHAGSYMAK